VRAVHGLVEREFYELEPIRGDVLAFPGRVWSWQLWFNYARESAGKGYRTPDQLRAERAARVDPKVFALPLVWLSSLSARELPSPRQIPGQDPRGHVSLPPIIG
jgi:hypothetical protein